MGAEVVTESYVPQQTREHPRWCHQSGARSQEGAYSSQSRLQITEGGEPFRDEPSPRGTVLQEMRQSVDQDQTWFARTDDPAPESWNQDLSQAWGPDAYRPNIKPVFEQRSWASAWDGSQQSQDRMAGRARPVRPHAETNATEVPRRNRSTSKLGSPDPSTTATRFDDAEGPWAAGWAAAQSSLARFSTAEGTAEASSKSGI